jgi:hypothetical protein
MIKKTVLTFALVSAFAAPAMADGFTNGGFESGTFAGWTLGSGAFSYGTSTNTLNAADYLPGGSKYNASKSAVAITTAGGTDAITGAATTFNGNHAVRVNDSINNYSVNVIKQSVTNYTDATINFAWNAVLEDSHGLSDSDAFNLTLIDDTTGLTVFQKSISSASAPGSFSQIGNWNTSGWQVETLNVGTLSGHNFTLSLLAADCSYGGHAGYVYLDGFGATIPTAVPEPETYTLMLAGLGLMGAVARRRTNKSAA